MAQKPAPFPRVALFGAAGLVTIALTAAAVGRFTGVGTESMPDGAAVESRELHFADRSDGAVAVLDARTGDVVDMIAPGTNGFMRSVMRGLARDRRRQDLGADAAFRLTRWADGRLSLEDEATGRRIDLGAFGVTNAEAFAQVLISARSITP